MTKEAQEMEDWRVANLLTKSAFARAVGVTRKTIIDIGYGRNTPMPKTYEKFCALRDGLQKPPRRKRGYSGGPKMTPRQTFKETV